MRLTAQTISNSQKTIDEYRDAQAEEARAYAQFEEARRKRLALGNILAERLSALITIGEELR